VRHPVVPDVKKPFLSFLPQDLTQPKGNDLQKERQFLLEVLPGFIYIAPNTELFA
jgi:hypothetical protein